MSAVQRCVANTMEVGQQQGLRLHGVHPRIPVQ